LRARGKHEVGINWGDQVLALSRRLGWIGVDVGTHTVKLAQAVRNGAEVRLHRAAVIQRPAAWSGDDAIALEQPITSVPEIRAALECGGFSGRDAICSLPMNACQLRSLNVPPGTDRERRTMIADELAEDWQELRQPMEFDFWEMETGRTEKGTDSYNVSVLAASRHWVGQVWRDCRKAGLDCWAVDGAPLAMARALTLIGGVSSGRRVLAVDWGYSNTTLCIVGDERPLYTRRIQGCTFGLVIEGIMRAFNITLDEAQHLADTQGLAIENSAPDAPSSQNSPTVGIENARGKALSHVDRSIQTALTAAAESPIEELIKQIRRTLQFMEAQRRHLQPTAIWLMGGGASLANAASFLQHAAGIPVNVWQMEMEQTGDARTAPHRPGVFAAAAALSASAWRAA
jgi:type IV pilus assembly protein PilM